MIVITGGAGFIGSNLHAALAMRERTTVIVDRLGSGQPGKWRNLRHHPPAELVAPEDLEAYLGGGRAIEAMIHLGAVSSTTAVDGDAVWQANVATSRRIWDFCVARGVRLIFASSAATYGDGSCGFDDDTLALPKLQPLNLYGWSKHVFDLHVVRCVAAGERLPPQWVGLKFFNVYGPNEYHKGSMISVVKVKYDEVAAGYTPTLFRSDHKGVADGEQRRDFVWVGDVVDVMLFMLDTPGTSGLFNVGTGVARSYRDMARAVCAACDVADEVAFVDIPESLRGQYQHFTQAPMGRLREAGYGRPFTTLEDGVGRYVRNYLRQPDPYV